MNYRPANFGPVTDDRLQTGYDAYEPTVHVAQVGSKTIWESKVQHRCDRLKMVYYLGLPKISVFWVIMFIIAKLFCPGPLGS